MNGRNCAFHVLMIYNLKTIPHDTTAPAVSVFFNTKILDLKQRINLHGYYSFLSVKG